MNQSVGGDDGGSGHNGKECKNGELHRSFKSGEIKLSEVVWLLVEQKSEEEDV